MKRRKNIIDKNSEKFTLCKSDDEKFVRNFLLKNLDFFKNNLDLIEKLKFSHIEIGSSNSLLERQNKNFRRKNEEYERKFSKLLETAEKNQEIFENLLTWINSLLIYDTKKRTIHHIISSFIQHFKVEVCNFSALPNKNLPHPLIEDFLLNNDLIATKVRNLCEVRFMTSSSINAKKWLNFIISANNTHFKDSKFGKCELISLINEKKGSLVIVPVKDLCFEKSFGVLILFSKDSERFTEGKGIIFLNQVSDIFSNLIFHEKKNEFKKNG